MSQEHASLNGPALGTMALTFLAGAAVGAIVVALTTPKSGPELRSDLKGMGNRLRRRASDLVDACADAVDMGA